MQGHIDKLRQAHRDLNRAIDTTRAAARQEDVKQLKKMRLALKDRIANGTGRRATRSA
ncbi:YdcH family protein [Alteriqipengyuania sp. 357]